LTSSCCGSSWSLNVTGGQLPIRFAKVMCTDFDPLALIRHFFNYSYILCRSFWRIWEAVFGISCDAKMGCHRQMLLWDNCYCLMHMKWINGELFVKTVARSGDYLFILKVPPISCISNCSGYYGTDCSSTSCFS
jgi:hypothetical protein